MRLVMKFGGTSIGDAERIKRVSEIVANEYNKGNEIAVVVSAMPGVTDSLIEIANQVISSYSKADKKLETFFKEIRKNHKKTITEVITNIECRDNVINKMDENLKKLRIGLQYVKSSKELAPASYDYIVSFGEKLSAPIISGAIEGKGIESISLTGDEAGIITDSNFGNSEPIMTLTKKRLSGRIIPLLKKGVVPVVTGFIAKNRKGVQTTLGRGGSDYTASIIGASISADEVIIWKDVEGFMTADPKVVPNARLINTLSYGEAIELASFGAKILHPRAIEPLIEKKMKMHIKYTLDPSHPGTFVHSPDPIARNPITGIATINNAVLLRIRGARQMSLENVAFNVFKALDSKNVDVKMFASATSAPEVSLVIDENYLEGALKALKALKKDFGKKRLINYDLEKGYSIITVVGEGMRGRYGIAGEVFSALGEEDINVAMIAQSSSELNISFIVEHNDRDKAVRIVHKKFDLDKSSWALEYDYEE